MAITSAQELLPAPSAPGRHPGHSFRAERENPRRTEVRLGRLFEKKVRIGHGGGRAAVPERKQTKPAEDYSPAERVTSESIRRMSASMTRMSASISSSFHSVGTRDETYDRESKPASSKN